MTARPATAGKPAPRRRPSRRGVTLIEMLVSVALLVLMMTIIVQVFGAATGAMSASRTYQELDQNLRQLSGTIRKDLDGVTARMTPPLDPKNNLGYFEYGENSFADLQGEDCDDYIRFTTKAPEGELFTGRVMVPPPGGFNTVLNFQQTQQYLSSQPITITSQYAEVIYFLRNNNLYRRVLLIVPERQSSIITTPPNLNGTRIYTAKPFPNLSTSWQGLNDVSAHPLSLRPPGETSLTVLNTLGSLTNRENRFAYSRFHADRDTLPITQNGDPTFGADGVADDLNRTNDANKTVVGDGVPDYWPTLYAAVFNQGNLITERGLDRTKSPMPFTGLAFPYTFPGAYSAPIQGGIGAIHSPDPGNAQTSLALLNALNHNPLELGDSLPKPSTFSTWWGFPTWRETMSEWWKDPIFSLTEIDPRDGLLHGQSPFLIPGIDALALPPLTTAIIPGSNAGRTFRDTAQTDTDGLGSPRLATQQFPNAGGGRSTEVDGLWFRCWEDDLIMTGVRSFDVKAYDDVFQGYADLGWGNDLRTYTSAPAALPMLDNTPAAPGGYFTWPDVNGPVTMRHHPLDTFAHEGRMPPLIADNRADAQFPSFLPNVGDDNASLVRIRRVWDSWSTDYTETPANTFDPTFKYPTGPPYGPPPYPSYPPPYPAPLRGLRIQIRVVDPRNERVKVLTLIQDFTDKL